MINYKIIDDSINYYEKQGFTRIESPWTVTEQISNITKPELVENFVISNKKKVLVGSGEQSFLYLYLKGFIPPGKFQTTTPCFRDDSFDELHTKYFIKNELIITDVVTDDELRRVTEIAFDFFWDIFNEVVPIKNFKNTLTAVATPSGYDIEFDGMELGSYGIRSCNYLKWIYATGVAEPRLSTILNIAKQKTNESNI